MKYWILIVMGLLCAEVFADEPARLNVIAFSAQAAAEVPNDQIEILLNVEKEATRAAELAVLVNTDMRWALDTAKKEKRVDARTQEYRTEPRYDKTRAVVGWRATQTLRLRATDVEAATELATTLQQRLLIKSMAFRPTNATREAVEDQLTVKALKRFRERADMVRRSMNMDAYDIIEIHIGDHRPPPRPVFQGRMAMAMEAGPSVAASAGTSELTVTVNGRIQLR